MLGAPLPGAQAAGEALAVDVDRADAGGRRPGAPRGSASWLSGDVSGWRFPLGLASLGLAVAAGLAVAVSAAQLLPVLEFTQRTSRAAEGGPHEIYPFSLEPARLAGLIWPNVLGNAFDGNTSWSELVRPPGSVAHVWVPSIYLGGLTLVLALGTLALARGSLARLAHDHRADQCLREPGRVHQPHLGGPRAGRGPAAVQQEAAGPQSGPQGDHDRHGEGVAHLAPLDPRAGPARSGRHHARSARTTSCATGTAASTGS